MTADLSEFEDLGRRVYTDGCKVAVLLRDVSDDERANVDAAFEAAHISHTAIAKWLKVRGIVVSDHAVRRHRLGLCCCG